MDALEREQLKNLLLEPSVDKETDTLLQNLDSELKSLIEVRICDCLLWLDHVMQV